MPIWVIKRWRERTRERSPTAPLIVEVLPIVVAIPLDARHIVPTAVLTLMVAPFLIALVVEPSNGCE